MYPPAAGSDADGNIFIPFTATQAEIPFDHWQMTTKLVFKADMPIVVQSVIITNKGEVFVQYAQQVNDLKEYPTDGVTTYMSLVNKEEKRSYE